MLPPADRQPAYVLHRRAFRETSAIVELLTRDYGRVGGVLRGAKRRRRGAHPIEPFVQLAVTWRGRGQLVNVFGVEPSAGGREGLAPRMKEPSAGAARGRAAREGPAPRREEPLALRRLAGDALFAGLYLNEVLMHTLSRQEPAPALFAHYGEALAELASGDDLEPALRRFERRLLEELGYGLAFDVDIANGRPIDRDKEYLVVAGEGFREAVANGAAAAGYASANGREWKLTGAQIAAVGADDYRAGDVRLAAKRVFRRALEMRLDGKSLATRELFGARDVARRKHTPDAA